MTFRDVTTSFAVQLVRLVLSWVPCGDIFLSFELRFGRLPMSLIPELLLL